MSKTDTIAAIATAPGQGGIGVLRVSGPEVSTIVKAVIGKTLKPRLARLSSFAGWLQWPTIHVLAGE